MSTLTKINGQIDNPNLPILTANGLIDQQIGGFLVKLEEAGYTPTLAETTAITTFVNTIRNHPQYGDMTSYIRAVYPFMGDLNNKAAAKIGIFTDTLFKFDDNFSSFELDTNDKIQGITAIPSGAFKLSEIAEEKFMDVQLGIKKPQTSSQGTIDILRFGSTEEIGYRLNDYKLNLRFRRNGTIANISFNNSISSPGDAGFYQYRGGAKNNDTETGQYVRAWKKNGASADGVAGTGSTSNPVNVLFTENDLNLNALSKSLPSNYSLQCIVVYAKRTTTYGFFFNAIEQLMIDLGRIQTNND